ncbi:hypothetical protein [Hyalangium versicolor]|uniref:hypothetical protein n=1 Tax=Hyalangium versicolor TaxID=2861190 RepID=UPI001CC9D574|nr:hypothetical protein [Hyalangium versicolor]
MATLKTLLTFMLAGAFIGNVVASFTAPYFMAWYNSTSLATETVCNLPEVVRTISSDLFRAQLIGSGIGAVAFLVLGILFVRARARKQRATPPPTAPTPSAAA